MRLLLRVGKIAPSSGVTLDVDSYVH